MYESIKAAVAAREAAEHFGITVSRFGMAICPFHDDHTPSLKLDERYHCFGCGADGDAIDFTAQLLGISDFSAAQKLTEEFGIDPGPVKTQYTQKKSAVPLRHLEQRCLFALVGYERLLRFWKKHYAPIKPGEPFHDRFVEACHRSVVIAHLIDELSDADPWRRRQVVDLLTEDDRIHRLQEYVRKKREEEENERKRRNENRGEPGAGMAHG